MYHSLPADLIWETKGARNEGIFFIFLISNLANIWRKAKKICTTYNLSLSKFNALCFHGPSKFTNPWHVTYNHKAEANLSTSNFVQFGVHKSFGLPLILITQEVLINGKYFSHYVRVFRKIQLLGLMICFILLSSDISLFLSNFFCLL